MLKILDVECKQIVLYMYMIFPWKIANFDMVARHSVTYDCVATKYVS